MKEAEGTYSQLVEVARDKPASRFTPKAKPERHESEPDNDDLSTVPYISQNYRFTEDELRWLRRQSLNLTERLGSKVSQNTILRFALQFLREAYTKSPKDNPLLDALSKLKR